MIAFTEAFTLTFRQQIGEFALANRLPMVAELREFAVVGGLASYGTSRADLWLGSYSSSGSVFLLCRLTSPGLIPGPTNSFPMTSATASASSPSFTGTLFRTNSMALSLTGSYARKFRTIRGFPSESKVVTRMFHPAGIVSPNCCTPRAIVTQN